MLRLALAALLLAGTAHAGETLDTIRARGTLRVGTTGDYKPFTFRQEDGSFTGADIDMADRLATRLGVRVEIVPTIWSTLLPDFKAQKFDVAMGGVSVTPARAAAGVFSPVTFTDGKRPIAPLRRSGPLHQRRGHRPARHPRHRQPRRCQRGIRARQHPPRPAHRTQGQRDHLRRNTSWPRRCHGHRRDRGRSPGLPPSGAMPGPRSRPIHAAGKSLSAAARPAIRGARDRLAH